MRRILPVLLVIGVLIGTYQPVKAQTNVIKINVLSLVVKTVNVSYELALSESNSVQLGFFYTGTSIGDTKFSGFGITPEYRIYLSDTDAPDGVYFAPFLRYQNFTLEEEILGSEATYSTFGGGAIIGRHWIFSETVSLDLFLGPAYHTGSVDVTVGNENDFELGSFDGFTLRFGLTFGFAF